MVLAVAEWFPEVRAQSGASAQAAEHRERRNLPKVLKSVGRWEMGDGRWRVRDLIFEFPSAQSRPPHSIKLTCTRLLESSPYPPNHNGSRPGDLCKKNQNFLFLPESRQVMRSAMAFQVVPRWPQWLPPPSGCCSLCRCEFRSQGTHIENGQPPGVMALMRVLQDIISQIAALSSSPWVHGLPRLPSTATPSHPVAPTQPGIAEPNRACMGPAFWSRGPVGRVAGEASPAHRRKTKHAAVVLVLAANLAAPRLYPLERNPLETA
jgi:hypothetical protein